MGGGSGLRGWLRRTLPPALVTMAAVLLTLGSVLLLDPEVGPAVLGIALAVTLSRSQLERDARGRLEAGAILPLLGLASAGVGVLLRELPWVGAAVFVAAISGSILLRMRGGLGRRIGRLLALPFVALLIAPPVHSARFGPAGGVLVVLIVGVIAWAWVTALQLLARRLRVLPLVTATPETPPVRSRLRPPATVRFALQTAVSLTVAFVVAFLLFPERWSWIVLTALIVTLGARGRADVLHKAIHRLVGSAAGTLLALAPIADIDRAPGLAIAIALVAVFVGVLFRDSGYALWALAITVALAIVQQLAGAPAVLLGQRWEEILIGAVIGVLPAWLLLPVRSGNVARIRISGVLAALQEQLAGPTPARTAELDRALRELRLSTRPFDELNRVTRGRVDGPPRWIALTEQCAALGRDGGTADARRALGEARRSIREPEHLTAELTRVRDALARRD